MTDLDFMAIAYDLAKQGLGTVSPNPMVGAVVVKDNEVISKGHHEKSGLGHAEYNALINCDNAAKATLYCTLEPCCHRDKKTPPCVDLIIEKEISRVVISNLDPNPKVSGKGVAALEAAGLDVSVGLMAADGEKLNRVFFTNMRLARPFVHLKQALTLDGRTATSDGDSKWITSEEARGEVHDLRYEYDAIMVGSKTANLDNPFLTCRKDGKIRKEIKRVVCTRSNSLREDLRLLTDDQKDSTIIVQNKLPIDILEQLYQQSVTSVLLEGGATLASTFIDAGLVDQVSYYISPKIVGNGAPIYLNDEIGCISESKKLEGSWRVLGSGEIVFEGTFICSQD
jgi:diaminohydroxyphosphoribosylaminopyrimidine deaminase/5-amino-6-(5-phosphoribosylamino)uracil reductase